MLPLRVQPHLFSKVFPPSSDCTLRRPRRALPVVGLTLQPTLRDGSDGAIAMSTNCGDTFLIEYRFPRSAVNWLSSKRPEAVPRKRCSDCLSTTAKSSMRPAHRRGANLPEFQILEFVVGSADRPGAACGIHRQRASEPNKPESPESIPRVLHFHSPCVQGPHVTRPGRITQQVF